MSSARKLWSYQCEWNGCGKSFKSISTFEAHYRRHTEQRPYACDYGSCGEAFHDRGALNRHHRTHANERPFACRYESCGQTFHESDALDQHYHTHIDQRLLACKYDSCGQAFHDRGELAEHHRTHKQRPLACEYDSCSRTFARRETLEAHMHMHTRERPFACTYEGCSKSFCDREGLVQHESSHTSRILQPCISESYNQTFTKPFQLHRHYHEEHEKTISSVEEVRPIRLRLSQPKRQRPESLEDSPRKRLLIRLPMRKTLCGTSISDPTAAPQIPAPNVHSQAPASQPTIKSRSTEQEDYRLYTDGQSIGHGAYVYTRVCGVYSREKAPPEKSRPDGSYHCPRCDDQFTRARGVMRHFVSCITRYGNPDSLKWTDHPSLQGTVKYYARKGHQGQDNSVLPQVASPGRNETNPRELFKHALLRSLAPKPLSPIVEENRGSVQPVYKPPGRDILLQKDIVQPIHQRRDALRRSIYNPETVSRDVLLAMGSHPNMDPLNAHLDILRQRFRVVNLESNMSTFRWDLVDPEREPEREPKQEPERQAEQEVEPEHSAPSHSEAKEIIKESGSNDVHWHYGTPSSFPSRSSTKSGALHNEVPFKVFSPEMTHFGPMSTIFSSVFDRDPSAKLMSTKGDLWAAIFTMLERRYHEPKFLIRAAVMKYTGDVIGWVACHEVDTFEVKPRDPSAYLDWTTAAHLLPSQISRFTGTKESAEEKAERSNQRKVGQGLASTIQARATEAQVHLVPIRRLVINALVVHPLHQGCGVASALLKTITEIADNNMRPIWVQAPEDPAFVQGVLKAGLFRRAGFTCAGELNLDLGSYASGLRERDKEEGVTFGLYKWNYMLRWPQLAVPKSSQRRSSGLVVSV